MGHSGRSAARAALLALASIALLGMGGFGGGRDAGEPARDFGATFTDADGTRMDATRVTVGGDTSLEGQLGRGRLRVPFENVARIAFRPSPTERDRVQADVQLRAGEPVTLGVRASTTFYDLATSLRESTDRLFTTMADLVSENRQALGDTAQHLASITAKLDRGTGTLGLLLNDPALYDRVAGTMTDVRESVQELGQVARSISRGESTLGKLATRDDGLYEQMRETVDSLQQTAQNAQEISDGLRAGDGTFGQMLVDDSLHDEAKDALRTVNRATQSVEDQSAISLLGTIVTSLF